MAYSRVNWQPGTKVSDPYVEVDGKRGTFTPGVYSGSTPCNPATLNIMDEGIKENSDMLNGISSINEIYVGNIRAKNFWVFPNEKSITRRASFANDIPSGIYTISGYITGDDAVSSLIQFYDENENLVNSVLFEHNIQNVSLTFELSSNCTLVRVYSNNTSESSIDRTSVFENMQLERGTYVTEYTPYKDFNSKSIPQQAIAPSNPLENDLWIDTTINALKRYNGTTWEIVGSIAQVVDSLDGDSTTNAPSIHAVNSRFAVLTGTISISNSITGRVNVDYPSGFNENNCVVIANMVNNLGSAKYGTGKVRMSNSNQGNANPSVTLSTNNIIVEVTLGEQVTNDYNYKVVLMKI